MATTQTQGAQGKMQVSRLLMQIVSLPCCFVQDLCSYTEYYYSINTSLTNFLFLTELTESE